MFGSVESTIKRIESLESDLRNASTKLATQIESELQRRTATVQDADVKLDAIRQQRDAKLTEIDTRVSRFSRVKAFAENLLSKVESSTPTSTTT